MQQATIGSKYQIVIPKEVRNKIKGLKPGAKVIVRSTDKETITIKKVKTNWIERTKGIAKEAWIGIDTGKYLEDLRNEWDNKS